MLPVRLMIGVPSTPFRIQPARFTAVAPGLYNSIHASLVEAAVPAQATSLITRLRNPAGVAVLVGVNVFVGDGVNVVVGVKVSVGVKLAVGVNVGTSPSP